MKKFCLALLCCCLSHSLSARELAGINVPESAQVGAHSLVLNGAGSRLMAGMFHVYVAALYLPAPQHTVEAALDEQLPKRLTLNLLFNVSSAQLLDATHKLMTENHSAAEMQTLAAAWNQFSQLFDSIKEFNKGDTIAVNFEPANGCQVSVNNRVLGQVPETVFMRAFLKTWLGERPAQANLKQQLLGISDSHDAH